MTPCIFLEGTQWGAYEGWLAVGLMGGNLSDEGDQTIILVEVSDEGDFVSVVYPSNIPKGRYRGLVMAPSGNLLVVEQERNSGPLPDGRANIREMSPEELLQFGTDSGSSSDLSTGAVVGIAIGCVAGVALVGGLAMAASKRPDAYVDEKEKSEALLTETA
jgi:hypothetical protein